MSLAIGCDLFNISSFRKGLAARHSVEWTAVIANGNAGSVVLSARVTVILALLGCMCINSYTYGNHFSSSNNENYGT